MISKIEESVKTLSPELDSSLKVKINLTVVPLLDVNSVPHLQFAALTSLSRIELKAVMMSD